MANTIAAGSMLLAKGTVMPESLQLESAPYSNGWISIDGPGSAELGRKIRKAGWTFFYMANEIKANVFGSDRARAVRIAVKRLLMRATAERFNCLEITRVAGKRFLGVPYVSVSAHSRHIQHSMVLSARRLTTAA